LSAVAAFPEYEEWGSDAPPKGPDTIQGPAVMGNVKPGGDRVFQVGLDVVEWLGGLVLVREEEALIPGLQLCKVPVEGTSWWVRTLILWTEESDKYRRAVVPTTDGASGARNGTIDGMWLEVVATGRRV
jgi:hypothetical protein